MHFRLAFHCGALFYGMYVVRYDLAKDDAGPSNPPYKIGCCD